MHVALTAIDVAARNVEQRDRPGDVQVPRASAPDLRVARTVQQQRHPPRLEIETDERPYVRAAELEHEAWFRFDEVRILISFADVRRRYAAATDRFRDVVQVGGARHHPQLPVRWC